MLSWSFSALPPDQEFGTFLAGDLHVGEDFVRTAIACSDA